MTDILQDAAVQEAWDLYTDFRWKHPVVTPSEGEVYNENARLRANIVAAITSAHLRQLVGTPDGVEQAVEALAEKHVWCGADGVFGPDCIGAGCPDCAEYRRECIEAAAPHLLAPVAAKLVEAEERAASAWDLVNRLSAAKLELKSRLQETERKLEVVSAWTWETNGHVTAQLAVQKMLGIGPYKFAASTKEGV